FDGSAYCVGRPVIIGGRMAAKPDPGGCGAPAADQAAWLADVVAFLNANYDAVAEEMGVQPTDDFISGNSELVKQLKARFKAAIDPKLVEDAPLAVQAQAPLSAPGLFPFDKYSSAYLLFDAVREDINKLWLD